MEKNYDLEDRLVEYTALTAEIIEALPHNRYGNYLGDQLIRSSMSPALSYGEAQSAESTADFIHKMKLALKELRESFISLKIIRRHKLSKNVEKIEFVIDETNQLIAIFVKSIQTAQKNRKQGK
jgi:four helix bundle protein